MTPITDSAELAAFCKRIEKAPFIAVDTEFMRETTYWPKLCLIQVASETDAANIDPLAEMALSPLLASGAGQAVMKGGHAARQDGVSFHKLGVNPPPLFDTQVAGMAAGFGEQIAYDALVRPMLKIDSDKSRHLT